MATPFIIQLSDMPIYLPRSPRFSAGIFSETGELGWLCTRICSTSWVVILRSRSWFIYLYIFAKSSLSMASGLGPHTSFRDGVRNHLLYLTRGMDPA